MRFAFFGREHDPDNPPPAARIAIKPGGALVDLDWAGAEASKAQARDRSSEARREARQAQVAGEAESMRQHQEAGRDELRERFS